MRFVGGRNLPMVAGAVFLIATIVFGYLFAKQVKYAEQTESVDRSSRNLLISLLDSETGQRGFVITGDVSYLVPYQAGTGEVQTRLQDLETAAVGLQSQDHMAILSKLISNKMSELAFTIDEREHRGQKAAIDSIDGGAGKHFMDQIREQLDSIEIESLDQERAFRETASFYARFTFLCLIATLGSCVAMTLGSK